MIYIKRLLIADHSEIFVSALTEKLMEQYEISVCLDGQAALDYLNENTTDILVVDFSLPLIDGLSLVSQLLPHRRPPLMIGLCALSSAQINHYAKELGFAHVVSVPTKIDSLAVLINGLSHHSSASKKVSDILLELGIPRHIEAYRRLCCAIPAYAEDPGQSLTKELYPYVARKCQAASGASVENSIRSAIAVAWKAGNQTVWNYYFPGIDSCPTSKQFIARLAELTE